MRKSIMTAGILVAALALATGVAGIAHAQGAAPPPPSSPPPDPNAPSGSVATTAPAGAAPALTGVSVFGILGYGDSIGVGGRYMLPVPIPALLTKTRLKDSWAVEFGADLLYWSLGTYLGTSYHETELIPIGGLMWNVWLNDKFAVYPKVEIGFGFNLSGDQANLGLHTGIYPSGAAGLLYQVTNSITLRAEVGSTGLRAGAGFFF